MSFLEKTESFECGLRPQFHGTSFKLSVINVLSTMPKCTFLIRYNRTYSDYTGSLLCQISKTVIRYEELPLCDQKCIYSTDAGHNMLVVFTFLLIHGKVFFSPRSTYLLNRMKDVHMLTKKYKNLGTRLSIKLIFLFNEIQCFPENKGAEVTHANVFTRMPRRVRQHF